MYYDDHIALRSCKLRGKAVLSWTVLLSSHEDEISWSSRSDSACRTGCALRESTPKLDNFCDESEEFSAERPSFEESRFGDRRNIKSMDTVSFDESTREQWLIDDSLIFRDAVSCLQFTLSAAFVSLLLLKTLQFVAFEIDRHCSTS